MDDNTRNTTDTSLLFSQNFINWFKNDFAGQQWLKPEYAIYDETAGVYRLNVDFVQAYRDYFPDLEYSGVLERDMPGFYDTGMLIELIYGELIRPESRDAFAQLVNLRLREFNAPLIFISGRFENINAEPAKPANGIGNRVTIAHKVSAALFIVIVLLSILRGC